MCIRDRAIVTEQNAGNPMCQLARFVLGEPGPSRTEKADGSLLHLGLELLERTEIRVDSLQPVSYTHLDVYKRQL